MAYTKLFYHAIWSTKYREPTITPAIEYRLYSYIAKKAIYLGGIVHGIDGINDHVHLVRQVMNHLAILNALRA